MKWQKFFTTKFYVKILQPANMISLLYLIVGGGGGGGCKLQILGKNP